MPARNQLKSDDRTFFSRVAQACLTNPFGEERERIVSTLAQAPPSHPEDTGHPLTLLLPALKDRFQKLEKAKAHQLDIYEGEDRELLKHAYLLTAYLQYVPDLDRLIERQAKLGATPAPVPFASKMFSYLKQRKFSESECLRYLALFYQLRRGFFFIDRRLVGQSESVKALRYAIWNNVFTRDARTYDQYLWNRMEDFSTLLLGETGTGKGETASAIGRAGFIPYDRKRGHFTHSFCDAFIAISLSQYPETLIESELFGHRKGAFTGAIENHDGLFGLCRPFGTLFLDEIGDASIPVQIKLLKVLQERTFAPVGSHKVKRFKGRVVAATNRSMADLRREGNFREDFYYRLCSDVIVLPPLRQRIEESPGELALLVDRIIERMTGQHSLELKDMVLDILQRDLPKHYPWPGNVRELEQAVRRILLNRSYKGDTMMTEQNLEGEFLNQLKAGALPAKDILHHYCTLLYKRLGSYEEVSRRTELDRRTVKKYIERT